MCNISATDDYFFDKALYITLKFEGGYVNHPNDPGGETNKGIIQRVYNEYRKSKKLDEQSVKFITDDEVKEIYYNEYWIKAKCDLIVNTLSIVHFDTSVNCGVKQSNKFLQRSIGVADDGFIGPATLKVIKKIKDENGLKDIINLYLQNRLKYYNLIISRNPKLKVFEKGWKNRVELLRKFIKL